LKNKTFFFFPCTKRSIGQVNMARFTILCVFSCLMISCEPGKMPQTNSDKNPAIALVIHGGAGAIRKESMTPERQQAYHEALRQALDTGYAVLASGGRSTDAIIASIAFMENSPLFNAGKGSVFTYSGKIELDASIILRPAPLPV
jgi:L-asparaginase / beta-aspartyl-peptidase